MKPWVAFWLPYLLIELFYIGMPVVRTDGRADGRSVYGQGITKFSRMGSLPRESFAIKLRLIVMFTNLEKKDRERQRKWESRRNELAKLKENKSDRELQREMKNKGDEFRWKKNMKILKRRWENEKC